MIDGFKPYSSARDSSLPWLGEIPAHWELRRTKTLLVERSEKGFPNEPLLAATQSKGVVRKEEYEARTVLALKDLHLLKLVHVGDFVVSLRSFQGGIEYARERGIISPAYTVLYPPERRHHAYLARLLKSRPYVENLSLFVTGIRQGQNIDYERLSRSYLPLPPLAEQAAIARFLDHTDRRIRRYIRAKQKLIALLAEQKQAIIHEAVTGQIDIRSQKPYPAYKSSGLGWIGRVPQHWDVRRIGSFSKVGNGSTPSRSNPAYWTGGDYPWLNSSSVNQGTVTKADQLVTHTALRECHLPPVPADSVLIGITGQGKTRGMTALLAFESTINQHLAYITPRTERVSSRYLRMYLAAAYRELRAISSASGSTKGALTCEDIKAFGVVLPPLAEQEAVLLAAEAKLTSVERSSILVRRQIDLAQEHRARLISDVVTGKVDVREVAAGLPEVNSVAAGDAVDEASGAGASSDLNELQAGLEEAGA